MNQYLMNELSIGQVETHSITFTEEKVKLFGELTGDMNPQHMDEEFASKSIFKERIVHGMYVGSLFSTIFGMKMPGLGSIYVKQSLKFVKPVFFGDTITAYATLREKNEERNRVYFDCVAKNQNDEVVIIGEAELLPPKNKENL